MTSKILTEEQTNKNLEDEFKAQATLLATIRSQGACTATGEDFFADSPSLAARKMCERCPVLSICSKYSLVYEEEGYWAGTTAAERRIRRKVLKIEHITPFSTQSVTLASRRRRVLHGDVIGWRVETIFGEEPCELCARAKAIADSQSLEEK